MGQDRETSFLPCVLYGKENHMGSSNIMRTQIEQTCTFVVRGFPGIAFSDNADRLLMPTELTFVCQATGGTPVSFRDWESDEGRICAYVTGWWKDMSTGKRDDTGILTTRRFVGDMSQWPDWVADEAQRHDPENAAPQVSANAESVERVARFLIGNGLHITDKAWSLHGEENREDYRRYARDVIACAVETSTENQERTS